MILTGCGADPVRAPLQVQLPPMPLFCAPVAIGEPKAGEFLLVIAKRFKATAQQANRRLVSCREWYGAVVDDFAQTTTEGPGEPVKSQ